MRTDNLQIVRPGSPPEQEIPQAAIPCHRLYEIARHNKSMHTGPGKTEFNSTKRRYTTPLSVLTGVQIFRFAGFAFILIAHMGILPMLFAGGGYGDIITGALALSSAILFSKQKKGAREVFLAFSAVGLIDLLNVAFLLLKYYPIWYSSVPNSAPAATFSLIMIPAIAAPVALLLHFYALRNFVLKKSTSPVKAVYSE